MAEPVDVGEKVIAASVQPSPRNELLEPRALELEVPGAPDAEGAQQPAAEHARGEVLAAERWIARVLRTGAVMSGGLFLSSLALELLPQSQGTSVAIDSLRKAGASLLLVTPVARLVVAGTALGIKGEWRYTLYAAGVLGLLAVAVGAGFAA